MNALLKSNWPMMYLALAAASIADSLAFANDRLSPLAPKTAPLTIVKRASSDAEPLVHTACYARTSGLEMVGPTGISQDAGRTWKPFHPKPDFSVGLPHGYRREPHPAVIDPKNGRIIRVYNALDTPGLDPGIIEPPIALTSYYLRYRVSTDGGRTWLFDEPVIEKGRTEDNPLEGVWKGKNGFFFGDIGCAPVFTRRNELLVPFQICLLGPDGKLTNPGGGYTYHEAAVLIGKWSEKDRATWGLSQRIAGDPARTTRGTFEPTIAEMPDGRVLMILRGSNARGKKHDLPSYKWRSVSSDGGQTWTTPEPWTYANGESFYSPSSMSQLFVHSSGRVFWIGNITPENANGNVPRYPLVVVEVDLKTLGLMKSSVLELDTRKLGEGRVDLSHFRAQEDRATKEIIVTVPRSLDGYKSRTWTTYRLRVDDSPHE